MRREVCSPAWQPLAIAGVLSLGLGAGPAAAVPAMLGAEGPGSASLAELGDLPPLNPPGIPALPVPEWVGVPALPDLGSPPNPNPSLECTVPLNPVTFAVVRGLPLLPGLAELPSVAVSC